MKKTLLLAAIAMTSFAAANAQTTLSAATNTPVAGDVFVTHELDTTGITIGASGASATWNYGSAIGVATDTIQFVTCASTPYCDSFPGSNLATYESGDYSYIVTSPSAVTVIGAYTSPDYIHFADGKDFMRFPLTYTNSYVDTSISPFGPGSFRQIDSNTVDAYGSLVLPSGTYPNALRVHTISHNTGIFAGVPVGESRNEAYTWYAPGFHAPLLTINIDTAETGINHITDAQYFTTYSTSVGVNNVHSTTSTVKVFPNPATAAVHITFSLTSVTDAQVTVADLTGRTISVIGSDRLNKGANDLAYSVAELPAGMYVIHLHTAAGSTLQKFVVSK